MTNLDAIDARISRRSYTGELSDTDFTTLTNETRKINAESGLSISLVQNGATLFGGLRHTYGLFSGVRSYFVLIGEKDNLNLKEKVGYYGEKLVLEATKLGLGTCWVGGTYDHSALSRALKPEQELVAVITVGPTKPKPTGKEKAVYSFTHSGHKVPEQMMTYDLTPPEWFIAGVTAASKAPSALNKQPVHFSWKKGIAHAEIPAERDFQWVDFGIAKLHFEIAAFGTFELGNSAVFTPIGETDICSI